MYRKLHRGKVALMSGGTVVIVFRMVLLAGGLLAFYFLLDAIARGA